MLEASQVGSHTTEAGSRDQRDSLKQHNIPPAFSHFLPTRPVYSWNVSLVTMRWHFVLCRFVAREEPIS